MSEVFVIDIQAFDDLWICRILIKDSRLGDRYRIRIDRPRHAGHARRGAFQEQAHIYERQFGKGAGKKGKGKWKEVQVIRKDGVNSHSARTGAKAGDPIEPVVVDVLRDHGWTFGPDNRLRFEREASPDDGRPEDMLDETLAELVDRAVELWAPDARWLIVLFDAGDPPCP